MNLSLNRQDVVFSPILRIYCIVSSSTLEVDFLILIVFTLYVFFFVRLFSSVTSSSISENSCTVSWLDFC